MLHLTMLTFDQAETELYGELQERGGRMTLAEISRLKTEYIKAVGDALSCGLAVSPLALRDAVEFGLLEVRSELKTGGITRTLSKSQEKDSVPKPETPFPGFQKY